MKWFKKQKVNQGRRGLLKALVVGSSSVAVLKATDKVADVEKGFHNSSEAFWQDEAVVADQKNFDAAHAHTGNYCGTWDAGCFQTSSDIK